MKSTTLLILSLAVAGSAAAHHSFAVFFATQDKLSDGRMVGQPLG